MASNPFSSDYVGSPVTQAALAQAAPIYAPEPTGAVEQPISVDIASGFKMTPIPMVSGKPKRVILRGKVTRD